MQIIKYFIFIISILCVTNSFGDGYKYATGQIANNIAKQQPKSKFYYYHDICNTNKHGTCVKFFSKSNVQYLQARGLIDIYLKKNKNLDSNKIRCSAKIYQHLNDDYIACSTTDDKQHFQFIFDDVFESIDNEIHKSVVEGVCRIYGGIFDETRPSSPFYCTSITELKTPFQTFGYTAIQKNKNNQFSAVDWQINTTKQGNINTIQGIDNYKFKNIQIKSGADLKFLIKRYVETQLKKQNVKLTSFNCNNSFTTLQNKDSALGLGKDDVLTCYTNKQPVDFVFDDLNEAWNTTSNGGTAGLQCIALAGGTFDGRRCRGFTKQECTELNNKISGGTHWDTKLDTCVLKSANKSANLDRGIEIATAAGIVAVGTVSVVLSGGTSLVVIIGYTGAAAAAAGTATSQVITTVVTKKTAKFLSNSEHCKVATCAKEPLKDLLISAKDFENAIPAQTATAVNEEIARLTTILIENQNTQCKNYYDYEKLKNMSPEKRKSEQNTCVNIGCGLCNIYFNAAESGKSPIMNIKTGADILTVIGDLVTIYPATMKIADFLKISPKFTNLSAISGKITMSLSKIGGITKVVTNTSKATDVGVLVYDSAGTVKGM